MIGVEVFVRHSALIRSLSELLPAEPKVAPNTVVDGSVTCSSAPFFVQGIDMSGGSHLTHWTGSQRPTDHASASISLELAGNRHTCAGVNGRRHPPRQRRAW